MPSDPLRIGKGIRHHRDRLGLTQEELGERVGVTQAAVAYWESGRIRPNLPNLVELVEVFGITVDELLRYTPSNGDESGEAA